MRQIKNIIMKKVTFMLFLIFIIRVFNGCCRCGNETTTIHFNAMSIVQNDDINSHGELVNYVADTMLNSRFSFTVALYDTNIAPNQYYFSNVLSQFSFTTANATTCDCYNLFRFDEEIVKVSIYNLYELSPAIPANTDVSAYFAINSKESLLYKTIDKAISEINTRRTNVYPSLEIQFFCTETIQNDSAQFIVNVELSNNITLSAFTPIVYLVAPKYN